MVEIVGVASAVFLGVVFFGFFGTGIFFTVKHLFVPMYKETGKDQLISFTVSGCIDARRANGLRSETMKQSDTCCSSLSLNTVLTP